MFTPVGASASTVPARDRPGIASKVTSTFWFGETFEASDSSNGTTTWKVLMLFSTMNAPPPGRVAERPDAALPAASLEAAAPTPGMEASEPGDSAVVPEPAPMYSPTAPVIAETVPPTGARRMVLLTSFCASATTAAADRTIARCTSIEPGRSDLAVRRPFRAFTSSVYALALVTPPLASAMSELCLAVFQAILCVLAAVVAAVNAAGSPLMHPGMVFRQASYAAFAL